MVVTAVEDSLGARRGEEEGTWVRSVTTGHKIDAEQGHYNSTVIQAVVWEVGR